MTALLFEQVVFFLQSLWCVFQTINFSDFFPSYIVFYFVKFPYCKAMTVVVMAVFMTFQLVSSFSLKNHEATKPFKFHVFPSV